MGASVIIEENAMPFQKAFLVSFRHPKNSGIGEDSSVLTEIKINSQHSSSLKKKRALKVQIPSVCREVEVREKADENEAIGFKDSLVLKEIMVNWKASSPSPLPSNSLKRKRPLKIQIPPVSQQVQTPMISCGENNAVKDETVGFDSIGCSVFCKKGKKTIMEDTHKMVSQLHGDTKKGFFGVYDGHGGRKAADFVAENLHCNILGMLEKCSDDMGKEEAVKAGYLKTDKEFLEQGLSSGTCCVTTLIEQGDIVVSNLGDCRAVLCRGGVAEALTIDHKAGREDERNRIEEKGGYVDIHHGVWRIQGTLSVSRSIGDKHLKDWVSADPDTKVLPLTSDMEFLILASDGLWDKVSNQEAIDTAIRSQSDFKHLGVEANHWKEDEDVYGNENDSPPSKVRRISSSIRQKTSTLRPNQDKNDKNILGRPMLACKELVNLATSRGSLDDITVMIIDLKQFHCA